MLSRRLVSCLTAVATLAVLVPAATAGSSAAAAVQPKSGGTLSWVTTFSPPSLDPARFTQYTHTASGAYFNPLFDSLLRVDAQTGKLGPGLAKSLTTTDAVTWTLKLRPNLKFSNGDPLDATAVKFNWDRSKSSPTFQSYATSNQIASTTVVDPTTLTITLAQPNGIFDQQVAFVLGVIGDPADIQAQGATYGNPGTKPIGAGPFVLTNWTPDSNLAFEKNTKYWDAPRPYISKLQIQINVDQETNYTSVTTGQNDISMSTGPEMTSRAKEDGFQTYAVPVSSLGAFTFYFNLGHAPFNDVRARKALNYAIDPKLVDELMWSNQGALTDTLWTKKSYYYDKSLKVPAFNHQKAQDLFNEVAKDTGKPVSFRIQGYSGQQPQLAEVLITLLGSYRNVTATAQLVPSGSFTALIQSGDWDAIQGQQPFNTFEPEPPLSAYVYSKGRNFKAGYADPQQDKLIDDAKLAVTLADRKKAYHDYARYSLDKVYQLNLGVAQPDTVYIANKAVKGISMWQGGFNYNTMWLAQSS
jgi:peptide/nickel transport system substrate-binding protein